MSDSKFNFFSIHNIIKEKNLILLQQILLQEKITLDYKDIYENSLLHIAVSYNNYEICKYLVDSQIDLNTKNIWNMTPLEEAIHLKYNNISNLLRNNKGVYKNKLDSEQIIFGDRELFFEKIHLIIQNLVQFFPNYCSINFFHNTYNSDYLFCCSKYQTKDASFHNYISHVILSKNLNFLDSSPVLLVNTITKQEDFIFHPYCKIYNIYQVITIPLKINNILVGYFLIFNSKVDSNVNVNEFEKLFHKIMISQFFFLLQHSYQSYLFNIQQPLIQEFLKDCANIIAQKNSDYDLHISILHFLDSCKDFWTNIKDEFYFKKLVNIVLYYNKALVPFGSLKKIYIKNLDTYESLIENSIVEKTKFEQLSFCREQLPLIKFDTKDKIEKKTPYKMSEFDYFKVIGEELPNNKIKLLNLIQEKIFMQDDFHFDIYIAVNNIISKNDSIRKNEVVGVSSRLENTFFVFSDEIEESLSIVFENVKKMNNILDQIYYLFYTISQYIHPFSDGNGRTCRIIASFYLKKIGIDTCISKIEKLISHEDFLKKIKS